MVVASLSHQSYMLIRRGRRIPGGWEWRVTVRDKQTCMEHTATSQVRLEAALDRASQWLLAAAASQED